MVSALLPSLAALGRTVNARMDSYISVEFFKCFESFLVGRRPHSTILKKQIARVRNPLAFSALGRMSRRAHGILDARAIDVGFLIILCWETN